MKILKRNGELQELSFDKVLYRLKNLKNQEPVLNEIDIDKLAQKVISQIYDGVSSKELDEFASKLAIEHRFDSAEYEVLSSRIIISNLHKEIPNTFSEATELLYKNEKVNSRYYSVVMEHKDLLDRLIEKNLDFTYDYFAYKTLEKSYLFKIDKKLVECPQYLLMRVAVGIHYGDIEQVKQTYFMLSQKLFTHASPTLYNAGTNREQLASCYLIGIEDSMKGIFKCISDCAIISKYAGGIGVHISNIRSSGSKVKGTNGFSDGIAKMLKVFNATAVYANQGSRRNGSFAMYLEPHHADIFEFLELPLKHGDENKRARDLFYALWVSDLFMKQVESDGDWWLMSSDDAPNLNEVYGSEYELLYFKYVNEGKFRRKIKARELWDKILTTQIETGVPYISYKDTVNRRSNQKNVGTIKSSNLCNEINIYSDEKEYGCCNLASISLPAFIENGHFNFNKLGDVTKQIVLNLNRVIDINFYPVEETRTSNLRHRPIGIGVQGFANALYQLKVPFESPEARELNVKIFETIYYFAIKMSCDLAKVEGKYSTFDGSPFSQGIFQFDYAGKHLLTDRYNWDKLKEEVKTHGTRNSLLTACMPTASTSNILNNFESFEPITHNLFMRRVLSGEYSVVNKYLIDDLRKLNLWNTELFNEFKKNYGSIQNINGIPQDLKDLYKDVYEVPQKVLIDLSADRQHFIDQSQSLNIYFQNPTIRKLTSMHFYGWKAGLKTGMYYLRSASASEAAQFTVNSTGNKISVGGKLVEPQNETTPEQLMCSLLNKEACEMCSG